MTNTPTTTSAAEVPRPALTLYHANARRTGSALRLELHPAEGSAEGYIRLTLAAQEAGEGAIYPRFNWEGAPVVKLPFLDVCEILRVLRGEIESANDGAGLYHVSAAAAVKITIRHEVEPLPRYAIEIARSIQSGCVATETAVSFNLSHVEALGVSLALEQSITALVFGRPNIG